MKIKPPNFTGKTVSVGLAGEDTTSAIENPRFEMQAGRLFLVGTVPRGGSPRNWAAGIPVAVAWDQVQDYMIFDSAEDYRVRLKKYHAKK